MSSSSRMKIGLSSALGLLAAIGIAVPTFARSITTSVLNRFTLPSAKNSDRVSASYSAMSWTVMTSTKSTSPVT